MAELMQNEPQCLMTLEDYLKVRSERDRLQGELKGMAEQAERNKALIAELEARIKQLQAAATRFVPVTERLPENDDIVVVLAFWPPNGDVFPEFSSWDNGWTTETGVDPTQVTHWMAIPPIPKVAQ